MPLSDLYAGFRSEDVDCECSHLGCIRSVRVRINRGSIHMSCAQQRPRSRSRSPVPRSTDETNSESESYAAMNWALHFMSAVGIQPATLEQQLEDPLATRLNSEIDKGMSSQ